MPPSGPPLALIPPKHFIGVFIPPPSAYALYTKRHRLTTAVDQQRDDSGEATVGAEAAAKATDDAASDSDSNSDSFEAPDLLHTRRARSETVAVSSSQPGPNSQSNSPAPITAQLLTAGRRTASPSRTTLADSRIPKPDITEAIVRITASEEGEPFHSPATTAGSSSSTHERSSTPYSSPDVFSPELRLPSPDDDEVAPSRPIRAVRAYAPTFCDDDADDDSDEDDDVIVIEHVASTSAGSGESTRRRRQKVQLGSDDVEEGSSKRRYRRAHGELQSACHYDKIKSNRPKMSCSNKKCTTIWCDRCIFNHFCGPTDPPFVANGKFLCPLCRDVCTCARCRRRRTGELPRVRTQKDLSPAWTGDQPRQRKRPTSVDSDYDFGPPRAKPRHQRGLDLDDLPSKAAWNEYRQETDWAPGDGEWRPPSSFSGSSVADDSESDGEPDVGVTPSLGFVAAQVVVTVQQELLQTKKEEPEDATAHDEEEFLDSGGDDQKPWDALENALPPPVLDEHALKAFEESESYNDHHHREGWPSSSDVGWKEQSVAPWDSAAPPAGLLCGGRTGESGFANVADDGESLGFGDLAAKEASRRPSEEPERRLSQSLTLPTSVVSSSLVSAQRHSPEAPASTPPLVASPAHLDYVAISNAAGTGSISPSLLQSKSPFSGAILPLPIVEGDLSSAVPAHAASLPPTLAPNPAPAAVDHASEATAEELLDGANSVVSDNLLARWISEPDSPALNQKATSSQKENEKEHEQAAPAGRPFLTSDASEARPALSIATSDYTFPQSLPTPNSSDGGLSILMGSGPSSESSGMPPWMVQGSVGRLNPDQLGRGNGVPQYGDGYFDARNGYPPSPASTARSETALTGDISASNSRHGSRSEAHSGCANPAPPSSFSSRPPPHHQHPYPHRYSLPHSQIYGYPPTSKYPVAPPGMRVVEMTPRPMTQTLPYAAPTDLDSFSDAELGRVLRPVLTGGRDFFSVASMALAQKSSPHRHQPQPQHPHPYFYSHSPHRPQGGLQFYSTDEPVPTTGGGGHYLPLPQTEGPPYASSSMLAFANERSAYGYSHDMPGGFRYEQVNEEPWRHD